MDKKSCVFINSITGNSLGLSCNYATQIINQYIALQKDRLKNNETIELFGLCKIGQSRDSEVRYTFGSDAKLIAQELGIPTETAITVIKEYLKNIRDEMHYGNRGYSINGLVTFKSYRDTDNKVYINTNKAAGAYPDARVFTSKLLKNIESYG